MWHALSTVDSCQMVSSECMARRNFQFKLGGRSRFCADILTPTNDFEFSTVFTGSTVASIRGLSLHIASVRDLRVMKESAVKILCADLGKPEADFEKFKADLNKHKADLLCLEKLGYEPEA